MFTQLPHLTTLLLCATLGFQGRPEGVLRPPMPTGSQLPWKVEYGGVLKWGSSKSQVSILKVSNNLDDLGVPQILGNLLIVYRCWTFKKYRNITKINKSPREWLGTDMTMDHSEHVTILASEIDIRLIWAIRMDSRGYCMISVNFCDS